MLVQDDFIDDEYVPSDDEKDDDFTLPGLYCEESQYDRDLDE